MNSFFSYELKIVCFAPILISGAKWSAIISVCRILTPHKNRIFTVAALGMSFNVKFAASLNQQHEAPHCASHSLESQHGVPPDESPGVCFKTHPRSQEKDEFGIRELWASPSQRQMCCLWLLCLILHHVIRLDFLVLMFLFYWFIFLKRNFFFASNLVISRKSIIF